MRVFCPTCQEPVTISDDLAGKATFCPLCKAAFTAPTLFSSSPATPAPPPPMSFSSPAPASTPSLSFGPEPKSSAPPSSSSQPSSYTRKHGFSFAPEILQWLAPACLGLAVLLTFFTWNGAYPGGHAVYTQSAWGCAFGGLSTDPVGEKVLKMNPEKPAEGQLRLRERVSWNPLILFFLPLLFATFAAAVFVTIFPMLQMKVPGQVEPMLSFRMAAVAGLALLALFLLVLQSLIGFGLENALERMAKNEAKVQLSDSPTAEEVMKAEIEEGTSVGRLQIRHTSWFRLEFLSLLVAVLAAATTFAMTRRTDRPHPRVEVMW
jgi:hypothetical protein